MPESFTINPDWGKQGTKKSKEKGVILEADSRDEEENARQEEDTLLVEDQEEQNPET